MFYEGYYLGCVKCMLEFKLVEKEQNFDKGHSIEEFVNFLHKYLEEYRDSKKDVKEAVDYALSKSVGKGGFLLEAFDDEQLIGGVVVDETGMSGYMPKHVLIYIAIHEEYRRQEIGRRLLELTIKLCDGDVSLLVEYENPAVTLFERVGFTSKYAEMRFEKG